MYALLNGNGQIKNCRNLKTPKGTSPYDDCSGHQVSLLSYALRFWSSEPERMQLTDGQTDRQMNRQTKKPMAIFLLYVGG